MTNDSTGSKSSRADQFAALSERLEQIGAALLSQLDALEAKVGTIDQKLEEQNAMLLALLPESMTALSPEELLALNHDAPATEITMISEFRSHMTFMPKGEKLEAGDQRVKLYANSPAFQVGLVRKREGSTIDLAELVRRRNEADVKAKIAAEKTARMAEAERLRRTAEQAAAEAEKIGASMGV